LSSEIVFRVAPTEAGVRLDKLIVRHAPGLGRRRAAELFQAGQVQVDGRRAKKGELGTADSEIRVELGEPDGAAPEPDAPLDVRLERPELVIVSKPAGQPSVALRGLERGTLAGGLLGHYPEMQALGSPREAGLIHRLDTFTSGLLLAARTADAHQRLRRALAAGELHKRYLAIVAGANLPGSGVIEREIAPHPRDQRRVCVGEGLRGARAAITEWSVVRRNARWALLEIEAPRALRHQIRVHLASIGHPIAGDTLYGEGPLPELGSRHALHASHLTWAGDEVLRGFAVTDPLPAELLALVAD